MPIMPPASRATTAVVIARYDGTILRRTQANDDCAGTRTTRDQHEQNTSRACSSVQLGGRWVKFRRQILGRHVVPAEGYGAPVTEKRPRDHRHQLHGEV